MAYIERIRRPLDQVGRKVGGVFHWLNSTGESHLVPESIAFQNPIDEICEEPAPRYLRVTLYSVVALFISLLLVAWLVKVDVVVVGTGHLVTDTAPIMLQPVERAIIRELNVKPGDFVTKGQVLATLDPTFAQADLGSLQTQQTALRAEVRRLEAELNDKPFALSPSPNDDERLQSTLYTQRQAQYKSRLRVFEETIGQLNASIRSNQEDQTSLGHQMAIAKDVEEMRAALMKSQSGSRLQYLDAQSFRMRTERDYQNAVSRLDELQHTVQSKTAEEHAFIEDWRSQLIQNLSQAETQLSLVTQGKSKASLINDMVVVTAPQDGVVLDVAQRSVGSVMHEGEPLVTIIPDNATLVAEINIGSGEIGYTKAGQEVVVKVDAFPYTRHGTMKGKLLYVSEESFPNGNGGGAFHKGRVDLLNSKLEDLPPGARLIPGMTLAAEIKIGARSVIGYFLTPITRGLGEAMREP